MLATKDGFYMKDSMNILYVTDIKTSQNFRLYFRYTNKTVSKTHLKLLMCTFDEVFGFKSAELMKCLQGRSLTQFATKNIGCFVYELNRESDYTDKNNVLLFVQDFFNFFPTNDYGLCRIDYASPSDCSVIYGPRCMV